VATTFLQQTSCNKSTFIFKKQVQRVFGFGLYTLKKNLYLKFKGYCKGIIVKINEKYKNSKIQKLQLQKISIIKYFIVNCDEVITINNQS
jgi:hypothetical protein